MFKMVPLIYLPLESGTGLNEIVHPVTITEEEVTFLTFIESVYRGPDNGEGIGIGADIELGATVDLPAFKSGMTPEKVG